MPRQQKRTKKLNNEALTKKDANDVKNTTKNDNTCNPLDALADKFIDLNELRQNKGPPPKGILELELEALVFEDLYNSNVEVSRNSGQKDNAPKKKEKLQESTFEDEELEAPTEKTEKEDIPEVSFIYHTF